MFASNNGFPGANLFIKNLKTALMISIVRYTEYGKLLKTYIFTFFDILKHMKLKIVDMLNGIEFIIMRGSIDFKTNPTRN